MDPTWRFEAIGTPWQIDTAAPLPQGVQDEVQRIIEEFDRTWSRFRADSVVTEMAHAAGTWELEHGERLLSWYDQLHAATSGAVNPLVGQALTDLGYDASYSLTPSGVPTAAAEWHSVRRSGSSVTTQEPVVLDVGAAGKGLLVDLVSDAVVAAGHSDVTVDASGDVLHRGADSIRVALEHPADPTRAIGVVDLAPGSALCGSATNRRAWGEGLHHVLDARTGQPTRDVIAAWVVSATSCMVADGLATAHFFAEPAALEDFQHAVVLVHADGQVTWSANLPGEVFV